MTEQETLIEKIIEGMREKKAHNITHVDLSKIETASAQHFVICHGGSTLQVDAIADGVREYVEKNGGTRPFNYDGYQNSQWIIIDYGSIFAHIFLPETRERYNLEQLWADATITNYPDE